MIQAAPSTDRRVVRDDGVALHYRVVGEGPRDVLLAHGLTSTGELEWRYLLPLLAADSRCLVPDLRGHGRSDHSDTEYGWDVVADDMRALLKQEGASRPHLVGFSFGSEVLLRMAVADPDLPASLVLLGTSLGRPKNMIDTPAPAQGTLQWPAALRHAHADKHGPDHWEALVLMMATRWRQLPEIHDDDLARVSCPTLVVVGENELPFKLLQARRLASAVPGARLVEVDGAGHEVHIEERDLIQREVLAHLSAADRPQPH